MTRIPLIAGNWKENLDHLEAIHLVQALAMTLSDANYDPARVEVAVIPPFTDIRSVQTVIEGDALPLKYGAQDVSTHAKGAYTGEISIGMLAKLGVTYVIVGHSERRQYHRESDAEVGEKARVVLGAGITPIICVGESLDVRKQGGQVAHVVGQVDAALTGIAPADARRVVIAYEPIWAIGTGEVATPADAQEVCGAIRRRLRSLYSDEVADAVRVLYGGSVKSGNVRQIMAEPDVDGGLVGGASLVAEEFAKIALYDR